MLRHFNKIIVPSLCKYSQLKTYNYNSGNKIINQYELNKRHHISGLPNARDSKIVSTPTQTVTLQPIGKRYDGNNDSNSNGSIISGNGGGGTAGILQRDNEQTITNVDIGVTGYDIIERGDIGFKMFLKNHYISSCIGFSGSIMAGILFHCMDAPIEESPFIGIIGLFASSYLYQYKPTQYETLDMILPSSYLSSASIIKATKDKQTSPIKQTIKITRPIYTPMKLITYTTLITSLGLMISPLISVFPIETVLNTAVISITVTGGTALYSLFLKSNLSTYLPVTFSVLTTLVTMNLLSLSTNYMIGPNSFSDLITSIEAYSSLGLFTFISVIDTQKAIKKYQENQPDFIFHSIDLILNTINIFINLLKKKK